MTTMNESSTSGKTGVILFHGLLGSALEMRYVANSLQRAGYVVHCPELKGYSSTLPVDGDTTWKDWYRQAEAAFLDLKKTCDRVIVGGHSTGAMLALLLAANHGRGIAGVTLFAPTIWLNGWSVPWYAGLFRLVTQKWFANMFAFPALQGIGIKDQRIREFVLGAMLKGQQNGQSSYKATGGIVLERRWLANEVRRRLSQVKQQVLILHPRDDDYADLNNASYIQRHLKGAVEMVVLDDCYHFVMVDRQRDIVAERTVEFVCRVDNKQAPARTRVGVAQRIADACQAPLPTGTYGTAAMAA